MNARYNSFSGFLAEVRAAKQPLCMVIFGVPGSGKGTYARKLSEALGIAHVETGAMIRAEAARGTELGKRIESDMAQGLLVQDKEIYALLEKRISEGDIKKGAIFDGIPRTLGQARELDRILERQGLKLNLAVNLAAPDEVVIKRMRERALRENRPDDLREGVIEKRISIYRGQSDPIIDYYRGRKLLVSVKAVKPIKKVYRKVRRRVRIARFKSTAKAVWATTKRRFAK